jgi:hypothetical protein
MKIYVPDIASTLVDLGVPAESQGQYLIAAIARVIAYRLPIPAEAVLGEARDHYDTVLAPRVSAAMDAIVERVPVDYDAVLNLTYQLWDIRYSLVHRPIGASGWAMLDACVNASKVLPGVSYTDATVQQLCTILADGVDGD